MVGDLPAPVYFDHRDDCVDARKMLGPPRHTIGIHRPMLEQPDLIWRVRCARVGEGAHRVEGRLVVRDPELAYGEARSERREARSGFAELYRSRNLRCVCFRHLTLHVYLPPFTHNTSCLT